MANRILIVDDDQDFNALLTDIFEQADYEVVSTQAPEEALQKIEAESFDLIVTDHRMPGLSGADFIREVGTLGKHIPVVMVSGYLEDEIIRNLIRDGVGGVFMKPLNIFSLLKKTTELIDKAQSNGTTSSTAAPRADFKPDLPFHFTTFAGKAPRAFEFGKRLHALRDFTSNLLLVGPEGGNFEGAARDLVTASSAANDALIALPMGELHPFAIADQLRKAVASGADQLTVILRDLRHLDGDDTATLFSLARKEAPFTEIEAPVRLIFCLTDELDNLFDEGKIDESLYIFLGTVELRMPSLADCAEDVPILAQRLLLDEAASRRRQPPQLDPEAPRWLATQRWPGEYSELRHTLQAVSERVRGRAVTPADLERARSGAKDAPKADFSQADADDSPLRNLLRLERDGYVRSAWELCERDAERTAEVLGVSPELVRALIPA